MDLYYLVGGFILSWWWIYIILLVDLYYLGGGFILSCWWIYIILLVDLYYIVGGFILSCWWIYIILLVDFFLDKEDDICFIILLGSLPPLPVDNSALSKVAVF